MADYRIWEYSAGGLPLAGITLRCGDTTSVSDREECYLLTEAETRITLTSAPIPPEQGSPTDIMYDFTPESVNKGTVTLSEVCGRRKWSC